MWLDWLVFYDYGFSVSALWCPLTTPTVLLGFLLPWTWDISSGLLQQSAAAAPYLGRGLSPHCCPSWPWTWNGSSRPFCTRAATTLWAYQSPKLLCLFRHYFYDTFFLFKGLGQAFCKILRFLICSFLHDATSFVFLSPVFLVHFIGRFRGLVIFILTVSTRIYHS